MSRRKEKQTDSQKLDLILQLTESINEKVEQQNRDIEVLRREVHETKQLVDEMSRKNRKHALIAGALGGGLVSVGFELIRLKFGG